jgi:hypothetical protein
MVANTARVSAATSPSAARPAGKSGRYQPGKKGVLVIQHHLAEGPWDCGTAFGWIRITIVDAGFSANHIGADD